MTTLERLSAVAGPDFSAVTAVPAFGRVVGALLTIGLIVSALLVVASAVT